MNNPAKLNGIRDAILAIAPHRANGVESQAMPSGNAEVGGTLFSMPAGAEERLIVMTAIDEDSMGKWLEARFSRVHGWRIVDAMAHVETEPARRDVLKKLGSQFNDRTAETKELEPNQSSAPRMPKGIAAVGVVVIVVLFAVDVIGLVTNLSGFAIEHTQSWLRAVLFVLPLALMTFVAKFVVSQSNGRERFWLIRATIAVGAISFIGLIWTFANQYAAPETTTDLLAPAISGKDSRLMLVFQVGLEVALGVGLMFILRSLLVSEPDLHVSNAWRVADGASGDMHQRYEESVKKIKHAEAQIAGFDHGRTEYIQKWVAIYRANRAGELRERQRMEFIQG